jgi:hypothetical protein
MTVILHRAAMALVFVAVAATASAAPFLEPAGGTGFLLSTAVQAPAGTTQILGNLTDGTGGQIPNTVDLYEVALSSLTTITTPFSISLIPFPSLFLFNSLGVGVAWAPADLETGQSTLPSILPGTYFLGISFFGIFPASNTPPSEQGDIFDPFSSGGGPVGPGGVSPLTGWYGDVGSQWDISAYRINFVTSSFGEPIPEPATVFSAAFALLGVWLAARRRRA